MKPNEVGSFRTFSEVANNTLGLEEDTAELIALSDVLQRIELLYRQDLQRFDGYINKSELDDQYFNELSKTLDAFCEQFTQRFGLSDLKARILRYVPVEEVVVMSRVRSDAHRQFLANWDPQDQFNKARGNHLFDFSIARSLAQNVRYNG